LSDLWEAQAGPYSGGSYPGNYPAPGPPDAGGRDQETAFDLMRRTITRSPLGRLGPVLGSQPALELVMAVMVAATVFCAAVPALPAYRVPGAPGLLVACAAGSTLVAVGAARFLRLSAASSYGLSLLGLVAVLLVADGPHPSAVASAVAHGPNRLLGETLPLNGNRATMSAVAVLVWVAGAATAEMLVRAAGRRRRVPYGLVVPIALYVALYAAASSAPGRDWIGGPLLLVLVAASASLWLQVDSGPVEETAQVRFSAPSDDVEVRPPSRYRPAFSAVVTAGIVAALLAGFLPHVGSLQRGGTAVHRQPPTKIPTITDPVDEMGTLRDGNPHAAPVQELTVQIRQPANGYLAMADLSDYDGAEWQFGATFQPTGGRVPDATQAPNINGRVTQYIQITGVLPVPLLPALDRPRTVSGLPVVADPNTGMLLPQAISAGESYSVVSQAPDAVLTGLAPADGLAPSDAGQNDLQLPPATETALATTERFMSTLTGLRPAPTVTFLQASLEALRTKEKRVDPTASAPTTPGKPLKRGAATTTTTLVSTSAGGTSLSEVINAITVNRSATPEQFATFYAMIARYLGVPARVVTGFRLAGSSGGNLVAPGTYQVSNRQAWAWVEIPVQGFGWVVADPTPDATTAVSAPPPESVQAPTTTLPSKGATVVPRGLDQGGHPLAPPSHLRLPPAPPDRLPLYIGLSLAGVLLLLLLLGPGQAGLRRALRRARRRSPDPQVRAVGAWLEFMDGIGRAGLRPPLGATAAEVAAEVGHHFGPDLVGPAEAIAATADQAVFSISLPLTPEAADTAWTAQRQLRRQIMATLDVRQRIRAQLLVGTAPVRPIARGR
jgi:hypothetical protein